VTDEERKAWWEARLSTYIEACTSFPEAKRMSAMQTEAVYAIRTRHARRAYESGIAHATRRVREYWDAQGLPYLPGVSDVELDAVAMRLGVRIPSELRFLYRSMNGTRDAAGKGGIDIAGYALWSIDDWRVTKDADRRLIFADFLENCWSYEICVEGKPEGTVWTPGYTPERKTVLYLSLTDFLHAYVENQLSDRDDDLTKP
jgi:hypothetical protein